MTDSQWHRHGQLIITVSTVWCRIRPTVDKVLASWFFITPGRALGQESIDNGTRQLRLARLSKRLQSIFVTWYSQLDTVDELKPSLLIFAGGPERSWNLLYWMMRFYMAHQFWHFIWNLCVYLKPPTVFMLTHINSWYQSRHKYICCSDVSKLLFNIFQANFLPAFLGVIKMKTFLRLGILSITRCSLWRTFIYCLYYCYVHFELWSFN